MSNGGSDQHEQIEIVGAGTAWAPVAGNETNALINHIHISTYDIMRNEAIAVLAQCVPPTIQEGNATGLVIGYVQSGKTMSFTTVAALARDNGYAMVIVIAGTSVPLTEQSRERLRGDLRIDTRGDRGWRHLHNPRVSQSDHTRIQTALADWRDPDVPGSERSTVLITVMKNYQHLNPLIEVLRQIDLTGLPVLIVDDEADQAGLNNLINEGDESTTYACLRTLKAEVPLHTFLQYTATPQGPLLINLIDVLSPGFAVALTPGPDYVGGQHFFLGHDPLVRVIPPNEIPSNANQIHEPPASLLEAMRLFFLGVASGIIRNEDQGNRSMMVHPTQSRGGHRKYHDWVKSVQGNWIQILEHPDDADYQQLRQDFEQSYPDLAATVPDLEPFEQLLGRLRHAIRRTEVWLVNSEQGKTPQIDWRMSYPNILVGGQALDRGYTVRGLTVTYMPRGVGARRADTIQQRARFFGYKRPYLGYCRAFLEHDVATAFTRYVRHEEDIRQQIEQLNAEGRSLDDFRRTFLLPRGLSATRDAIIDIDYVRARFDQGWFNPRSPQESEGGGDSNREVIVGFLNTLDFEDDEGHPARTAAQRHLIATGVLLRDAYEHLLLNLRFARLSDAQDLLGMLVILRNHLRETPDATCTIYQMSCGDRRQRSLTDKGEVRNLFQGEAPVHPIERRGETYPGDRAIHAENEVTIQIHTLDLLDKPANQGGQIVHENVPNIAIWIPSDIGGDVLIQDQGGVDDTEGSSS